MMYFSLLFPTPPSITFLTYSVTTPRPKTTCYNIMIPLQHWRVCLHILMKLRDVFMFSVFRAISLDCHVASFKCESFC
jgi:hypothetical protein